MGSKKKAVLMRRLCTVLVLCNSRLVKLMQLNSATDEHANASMRVLHKATRVIAAWQRLPPERKILDKNLIRADRALANLNLESEQFGVIEACSLAA